MTGQDVFLEYRHHDAGTKNDPSGLRPDTLPTPHAARLKICQRSPFLKSSNAKSWGPAGLPVGSDLVIDDRARKTLPTGGCDHAVSATTW
ncbi:hypothetical protein ACMFBO_25890 (plasmid) [Escherichia coli]